MENTSSLFIRRFGIVIFLLLAAIPLSNIHEHLFILENGSEIELKRALVFKALQLRGVRVDTCICNDNIQGYNVTGYQFMSLKEIKDISESRGELNYCCVSEVDFNGSEASVTVMNISRLSGYESALNGVMYRFHRYFLNFWGWNDDIRLIS